MTNRKIIKTCMNCGFWRELPHYVEIEKEEHIIFDGICGYDPDIGESKNELDQCKNWAWYTPIIKSQVQGKECEYID